MLFHDDIFISFHFSRAVFIFLLSSYSGGEETNPIPYDADASAVKDELEGLSSIATVHVERTPFDIVGGCAWTISFLEDGSRLHRGDMPLLVVDSSLSGTPGESPTIIVAEERKGTIKEVQTITVDGGSGVNVDPTSQKSLPTAHRVRILGFDCPTAHEVASSL